MYITIEFDSTYHWWTTQVIENDELIASYSYPIEKPASCVLLGTYWKHGLNFTQEQYNTIYLDALIKALDREYEIELKKPENKRILNLKRYNEIVDSIVTKIESYENDRKISNTGHTVTEKTTITRIVRITRLGKR